MSHPKDRPYGIRFAIKNPGGGRPIVTERWYANRSDRDRAFALLPKDHGARLMKSKKIGK